jgi:hypothetical protein
MLLWLRARQCVDRVRVDVCVDIAVYALVSFLRQHVSASQFRNLASGFAIGVVVLVAGTLLFLQVRRWPRVCTCVPVLAACHGAT